MQIGRQLEQMSVQWQPRVLAGRRATPRSRTTHTGSAAAALRRRMLPGSSLQIGSSHAGVLSSRQVAHGPSNQNATCPAVPARSFLVMSLGRLRSTRGHADHWPGTRRNAAFLGGTQVLGARARAATRVRPVPSRQIRSLHALGRTARANLPAGARGGCRSCLPPEVNSGCPRTATRVWGVTHANVHARTRRSHARRGAAQCVRAG